MKPQGTRPLAPLGPHKRGCSRADAPLPSRIAPARAQRLRRRWRARRVSWRLDMPVGPRRGSAARKNARLGGSIDAPPPAPGGACSTSCACQRHDEALSRLRAVPMRQHASRRARTRRADAPRPRTAVIWGTACGIGLSFVLGIAFMAAYYSVRAAISSVSAALRASPARRAGLRSAEPPSRNLQLGRVTRSRALSSGRIRRPRAWCLAARIS